MYKGDVYYFEDSEFFVLVQMKEKNIKSYHILNKIFENSSEFAFDEYHWK